MLVARRDAAEAELQAAARREGREAPPTGAVAALQSEVERLRRRIEGIAGKAEEAEKVSRSARAIARTAEDKAGAAGSLAAGADVKANRLLPRVEGVEGRLQTVEKRVNTHGEAQDKMVEWMKATELGTLPARALAAVLSECFGEYVPDPLVLWISQMGVYFPGSGARPASEEQIQVMDWWKKYVELSMGVENFGGWGVANVTPWRRIFGVEQPMVGGNPNEIFSQRSIPREEDRDEGRGEAGMGAGRDTATARRLMRLTRSPGSACPTTHAAQHRHLRGV
jgi:hypothetical protein